MPMSARKLALAAAILALPLAAAHAQSPMTDTPMPHANPDNAKDTSSKARREAAKEKQKKAEDAKKAHKPEKPDEGKKTPDANSPG
jgi:hypothetical protein